MSDRAAYSRVYWTIVDDPKFEHVYDDDAALAAWLRLLLIADQSWPASAHLPTNCRPKAVKVLVGAGLVTMMPGGRYRISGLDRERQRRKDAASGKRDPNGTQTGPGRDPNGFGTQGLSLAEPSRDEVSRANARADDPALEAYSRFVAYPSSDALRFITDIERQYGSEATARAIGEAGLADPNRGTLLSRTRAILAIRDREAERRERADEAQRNAGKRAPVVLRQPERVLTEAEIEAEIARYQSEQGGAA